MSTLGSFGRAYDRIELDFQFFGATIRVNPSVSKAAMVEFLAEAGGVNQNDEVAGARVIMQFMREIVHPEDFDTFWGLAKRERQDPEADLMPIGHAVMEAVAGFPTGEPSGSAPTPTVTAARSVVDLPLPDMPVPNFGAETAAGKALAALRKRPDLQEMVVQAQEQKVASNGRG